MALQARSDMEMWDRPFQSLLLGVLAINVAAHFENVPWWILIGSFIALSWKVGNLYYGWRLPNRTVLHLTGAIAGGFVFWEYKTAFGHEAGTPILVFLAALKILETNRDRDAMFAILTSYFLLMAHLLHSQTLASTLFMAADVAIITTLMVQLHRSDRRLTFRALTPIMRMLVVTIPIWMALFLLFPRFSLRILNGRMTQPSVGFSEGLNPTSVSSLADSNEVAFRVKYISGPRRSPENLYWRGATLYKAVDMKWDPPKEETLTRQALGGENLFLGKKTPEELKAFESRVTQYEVMIEASTPRTLFTLPRLARFDTSPTLNPLLPFVTRDELLRTTVDRRDRVIYRAWSLLEEEGLLEVLDRGTRSAATFVDPGNSPRLRALALDLSVGVTSPQTALSKIDEWYSKNGFRYSLDLGQERATTLEDFLFRTKKGFCEHFAAASAILLRSMGFATRVVVGYQGGKWNQFSNKLVVRSRDAHAWVEVWFPSSKNVDMGRWLTYDPTSMIAPLRTRLGGDYFDVPEEKLDRNTTVQQAIDQLSGNYLLSAYYRMNMMWDFAQASWIQFLLNYDQGGQRELLNDLMSFFGLKATPWILTVMIAVLLGIVLRLTFLWQARKPSESIVLREWNYLQRELIRAGIHQANSDGPLILSSRVESPEIRSGIEAFIELHYGPATSSSRQNVRNRESLDRIRIARRAARRLPTRPTEPARPLPLANSTNLANPEVQKEANHAHDQSQQSDPNNPSQSA